MIFKSLGPGFRRDDEVSRPAASIGDFPRTAVGLRRNDDEVFWERFANMPPCLFWKEE